MMIAFLAKITEDVVGGYKWIDLIDAQLESLHDRLISAKILADHIRYCNGHDAIHADMPSEEKCKTHVLRFQNSHHMGKVTKACAHSYGVYVNVDNDLIHATRTTCLPTDSVCHYTKEGAANKLVGEIIRIGTLVMEIYSQSEPMH
ncbi:hypothetical protein PR048_020968 [Dryococelus australis]|uniref:Uncharacterized protein n=1 Tax=Dryococelus australis TaxID=614101 RepID=A0ABQ9GWW9_9NEOP|nr:hypothetical protein PR048_020968 [Dryococelus australis]